MSYGEVDVKLCAASMGDHVLELGSPELTYVLLRANSYHVMSALKTH